MSSRGKARSTINAKWRNVLDVDEGIRVKERTRYLAVATRYQPPVNRVSEPRAPRLAVSNQGIVTFGKRFG